MKDEKKAVSMNENGAKKGDLYNGKVNDNLANDQSFRDENDNVSPPIINNPQFDFTVEDVPEPTTDEVIELPIWALPPDLQNVVVEVTKGYRSHRDFVISSLMCATACIVGKRVTVYHDNYTNHATLWLMIVADSGRGKSQPLRFFFEPIQEMENEAYDLYKEDMKQWKATKCEGDEPIYKHRLIGNATDEFVMRALAQVGDLCWLNDEMRATIESWGLYKNGANGVVVANLMRIFDYDSTSMDRVSSEPLRSKKPNLSMAGTTQPSVLKQMMGRKGYDKDGMFQRFLYAFPESKRPPRIKHIIGDSSKKIWRDYIKNLSLSSFPDLHETHEAEELHDEILQRWDTQAEEYEEHGIVAMGAYVDKLNYHLCRWCACVAVLRGDQRIEADVMRYSIECMEYFKWCAERAFCLIANDDSQPKGLTNGDILRLVKERYETDRKDGFKINQSELARALGISQQAVSKNFK